MPASVTPTFPSFEHHGPVPRGPMPNVEGSKFWKPLETSKQVLRPTKNPWKVVPDDGRQIRRTKFSDDRAVKEEKWDDHLLTKFGLRAFPAVPDLPMLSNDLSGLLTETDENIS